MATRQAQTRDAQRRRTRTAIVEAATRLVTSGAEPSVDDIAAEADVSRRTVYLYFPTLDQLLLDATVGALIAQVAPRLAAPVDPADESNGAAEAAAAADGGLEEALHRVDALVLELTGSADQTLPLGRRLIQLTVTRPVSAEPRRGYRRVGWLEQAVAPLRETLSAEQLDRLVSGLSVLVGWEAMVVLRDVRSASAQREAQVLRWAVAALVRAVVAEGHSAS